MTHRPLLGIVLSFGMGILFDHFISFPFLSLALAGCILLIGCLFSLRNSLSTVFIFLSFFTLGTLCSQSYQKLPQNHIYEIAKYYKRNPVSLKGTIISDVQKRDFRGRIKTTFELQVERFKTRWGWRERQGKILVNVFRDENLSYGDSIALEGKLYEPFNFDSETKFDYREYLNRRKIKLILSVKKDGYVEVLDQNRANPLKYASIQIKNRLKNLFALHLSRGEAGIMQAFILGDREGIPKHVNELFVKTGTAHILAISGQNIGIMAFLVFLILSIFRIPQKGRSILTMLILIGYAFLAGGQAPVVRATIMAIVFLCGFLLERETDLLNSLALAALILLVANPLSLLDAGFQLSFLSVFAIVVLCPKVWSFLEKWPWDLSRQPLRFFAQSAVISSVAWVSVVGLIAYYFQIFTPVSILANLFVVPCMTVLLALGVGFLLFGLIFTKIAFVFALCIKVILNLMVGIVYLFAQLPGGSFYLKDFSVDMTLIYYLIFCFLVFIPLARLTKFINYATFNRMKIKISIFLAVFLIFSHNAFAFWVWTPETNQWVNPKYAVKETPKLQLAYAMEFYQAKDYPKAVNEFEKLIQHYPKAREAAEAQYYIGITLEDQERLFQAYQAYQKVIDKYPFSELSAKVVEKEYKIGERFLEGEGKKTGLMNAVIGGGYDVIAVFRAVIKNAPYGSYAAPSQYKIGLYLQEKGLYQEARDEFEKVINDYPDSEWVKAAKYQIALVDSQRSTGAQYDQKITQAAVDEFKEFAQNYPDAELSEKAHQYISELRDKDAENNFIVAHFYEKQKQYDAARVYYNSVIEDFPGSFWAKKSENQIKELDSKQKK